MRSQSPAGGCCSQIDCCEKKRQLCNEVCGEHLRRVTFPLWASVSLSVKWECGGTGSGLLGPYLGVGGSRSQAGLWGTGVDRPPGQLAPNSSREIPVHSGPAARSAPGTPNTGQHGSRCRFKGGRGWPGSGAAPGVARSQATPESPLDRRPPGRGSERGGAGRIPEPQPRVPRRSRPRSGGVQGMARGGDGHHASRGRSPSSASPR